jgi:hypothetical protein
MDLNETLGRIEPATLAFFGGVVGGLAREIIRWRGLIVAGAAGVFLQPLFVTLAAIEVALGGGVATLARQAAPSDISPALALLGAFLVGAGLEELIKRGARLRIFSPDVPFGGGKARPTIVDFLRS